MTVVYVHITDMPHRCACYVMLELHHMPYVNELCISSEINAVYNPADSGRLVAF